MTSYRDCQERRLKLRIHAQTEDSFASNEGEEIRSPPELLVTQDLGLTDDTIVLISQRLNLNDSEKIEEKETNELILKASVHWKMKNFRNQVSLRGDLAERFGFKNMEEVFITELTANARPLTLVEFGFRDDYISRSDYWHFSDKLVNSCLYLEQVMEQNGIKAHVLQLYDDTKKVNSGRISTNTRVVFRSSSAQIFLFIQLSAEMWEFDELGDIYFERALKKFIRPLCSNWQQNKCHHELTVVYFSRTLYLSENWDQFPEEIIRGNSVQRLDNGTFYQDYYKVIIQDEIRSDWSSIISTLKREFFQYKRNIGLTDPDPTMPQCYNSHARYGNFLEAINLTLNIFEHHYHDRILDRTGQQFAMITPSQGVFENTQELIEITECRMLDYGIGTDIIFLTRQPLHAVPLFIYQDNTSDASPLPKYHVAAHWLNFSYLGEDMTTDIRRENSKYFDHVLKIPDDVISPFRDRRGELEMKQRGSRNPLGKVFTDYWVDEKPSDVDMLTYMRLYDTQIWKEKSELPELWETFSQTPLKISPSTSPSNSQLPVSQLNTPGITESLSFASNFSNSSASSLSFYPQLSQTISLPRFRPTAHPSTLSSSYPHEVLSFTGEMGGSSLSSSIPDFTSLNTLVTSLPPISSQSRMVTHSNEINPFNRNCHLTQTSGSRRRWAHCFPASHRGIIVRDNYLRDSETAHETENVCEDTIFAFSDIQDGLKPNYTEELPHEETEYNPLFGDQNSESIKQNGLPYNQSAPACVTRSTRRLEPQPHKKLHRSYSAPDSVPTLKVVGEVVEAFVKRGINWKSLIHPALCPITNDFFPGASSLNSDHYHLSTNIFSETLVSTVSQSCEQQVLVAINELISQRLVCGFQLITTIHGNAFSVNELLNINSSNMPFSTSGTKLWLGLGEVYHELIVMLNTSYNQLEYTANVYTPANLKKHASINYVYNLWPLGRSRFELASLSFQQSDLSTERWSHFDVSIWKKEYHQMMQQQDTFWSVQFILLPVSLPSDILLSGSGDKLREWKETKFHNFTTFLDQINAAKQKMSQRGSFSDPVNRRGSKIKSQDPESETTKEKLLECIKLENWSELVQTIQNPNNNFLGYFQISTANPNTRTNYFILSKLTDYLSQQLQGLITRDKVWNVILTLAKKGFILRFDDPTFSIQTNGYYICSFQDGGASIEKGHVKITHTTSAEQICAIEVLWNQNEYLTARGSKRLKPESCYLPPIRPDFNEGQRICPLLDSLIPCIPQDNTMCASAVHLSHDKAYSPLAGFRIELQFRLATTSLLNQAVSEFEHFAQKSGFVLRLYPSCRTLSDLFSHPFRRPYYIPLVLPDHIQPATIRIVEVMTLIAFKFGFIKESYLSYLPSPPYAPAQLRKDRFTHFTGQYFVSLVPQKVDLIEVAGRYSTCSPDKAGYYSKMGFLWWNNFLLNRETRSRVECKESNKDLSTMIEFCSGVNGQLELFLQEIVNISL